jgi:hypothetical protein
MRLRARCFLLVLAGAACNGASTPSQPSWPVVVINHTGSPGANGTQNETVTLEVQDPNSHAPAPGQTILLQVSAGDITSTLPAVTDGTGRATVVWTLQAGDHDPGDVQAIAFCSPPPGKSFCTTHLSSGAQRIVVTY